MWYIHTITKYVVKWKGAPEALDGGIVVSSLAPAPASSRDEAVLRSGSGWQAFKETLRSSPQLWIGSTAVLLIAAFCFLGPLFWTPNPFSTDVSVFLQPPSWAHPFGTDPLGRDELSRVMLGGQVLMVLALVAAAVTTGLGMLCGLAAAWWGGAVDAALTWLGDVVFGIPQLVPLVLIMDTLSPNGYTTAAVIAATSWPAVARLVRAVALSMREREYITAARGLGASDGRVLFRHLLPNLWTTVVVAGGLQVGQALILVALAGYVGAGLPPSIPTWGQMIANSASYVLSGYWWLVLPSGLAFALLEIAVNLVAEGLRQVLMRHPDTGVS